MPRNGIHRACEHKDVGRVRGLRYELVTEDFDTVRRRLVEADDTGDLPLHVAIKNGHASCVELIVRTMRKHRVGGLILQPVPPYQRNCMHMALMSVRHEGALAWLRLTGIQVSKLGLGSRAGVVRKLLDMLSEDEMEHVLLMRDANGHTPLEIASSSTRRVFSEHLRLLTGVPNVMASYAERKEPDRANPGGWLLKQPEGAGSSRNRWFVLDLTRRELCWYTKTFSPPAEPEPKGAVPLDTIIRVHQVGANLSITVVAGQEAKERDYILSAKTEVLAEGWAKLLDYECTCSTATPDTPSKRALGSSRAPRPTAGANEPSGPVVVSRAPQNNSSDDGGGGFGLETSHSPNAI